jgi:beta-glucosidase
MKKLLSFVPFYLLPVLLSAQNTNTTLPQDDQNSVKEATDPSYEFDHGSSSPNFAYANLKLSSRTFNGKIKATITIYNTSKVAGKEAVQLYLSTPLQELDKTAEELKAFTTTNLIEPGKSETLTFTLDAADLSSFDTQSSSWIAEAGKYIVKFGSSPEKIYLSATFGLKNDIVVEKDNKALLPSVNIDELKPANANASGFIYELNDFGSVGM